MDKIMCNDVVSRFRRQALSTPRRIAVYCGSAIYTYEELNSRIDCIAHSLVNLGVKQQCVVALAIEHGVDLIAAPLAVLKLGAVYLPIDKRQPDERLNYMLNDAQPEITIASKGVIKRLERNGRPCCDIDSISTSDEQVTVLQRSVEPSDPAYIIYTSGSTGKPKGVVVSRNNLASYCDWASDQYFDSMSDRIALYSTLSFDFTATCIFPPLMRGCSIDVYDGVNNSFVIKDILQVNRATIIKITPAYLEVLAELVSDKSVIRRLIVGGEDLKTRLAAKVKKRVSSVEIVNEYGPTEATVGCMNYIYSSRDNVESSVPIGSAIAGCSIEILDNHFEPVTNGEVGEIFIFGDSVAIKYLNNKVASSKCFLTLPKISTQRCYRTGDFARRNGSGDLVFSGRKDSQVKIRGNRVELGEVEATFRKLPFISSVCVIHRNCSSTNELVAALVLKEVVSKQQILAEFVKHVPGYMVPGTILLMEKLPMTPNQKIDRKAILMEIEEQRNELVG